MDDEDNARYHSKHYSSYNNNSSQRLRNPLRSASSSYPQYNEEEDEDDEQEIDDLDEEDDDENGVGVNEVEEDDNDGEDENENDGYNYRRAIQDEDLERHPTKKRKLKTLVSDYEFAPRASNFPTAGGSGGRKPVFVGRNSNPAEWTEHSTFVLLEAWGDRYLQLGRKSLRSDDWTEVAEKVSEVSKIERTDTQCRNRLDTLKKKYKKEKAKLEGKMGIIGGGGSSSKWVFFKKMDMLMAVSPRQHYNGLACGVDSGEYVFMNPKVYLSCSNGFDEMRDSPANSEESGEGDEDGNDLDGENDDATNSFRLLADSVQKFGEIYEKIENSKRQQMMELEKMRMDFHRELELQKKQILDKAQAEIEKIRHGDEEEDDDEEEDTDASAENLSG